jgi:putative ABC transport system ATP-binding protein
MLRLENVSKRYSRPDGDRVALDNLSLQLERGTIMGIFGPSGSGKTTLLRIAAGLRRPDRGIVTYDGERLDQMSGAERTRFRRREIACVWTSRSWQEKLSVRDHVAMPLLVDHCGRRSAERRTREALLACEAEHCVDMKLGELSDGERQRVAIARALIAEPRLLLADGPASNLSLVEQEGIMVLLSSLAREARVAVLITDSNAEALLRADPILYLRDGKLVNPEPMSELGRVYRLPSGGSRRSAADA